MSYTLSTPPTVVGALAVPVPIATLALAVQPDATRLLATHRSHI
jgi:hypothetical protein